MTIEGYSSWGTKSEVDFLNNMGTGKYRPERTSAPKDVLLKGYLKGAKKRRLWGAIDSKVVLDHAEALLSALK